MQFGCCCKGKSYSLCTSQSTGIDTTPQIQIKIPIRISQYCGSIAKFKSGGAIARHKHYV